MVKKINIWDIIAWVALTIIIVWVILKVSGIINTPLWMEYIPIYSAVYIAGWQIHKLQSVSEDVKDLKKFRFETIGQINNIKTNYIKNHYKK